MRGSVRVRSLAAATLALGLVAGLAACTQDATTEQYLSGDGKGYVGGDFRVEPIAPDERGEPIEFASVTEDGEAFSSEDVAGDVVVVNFWFANCGPCRVEAEDLESVWQEYQDQGVSFVGVNTYDQADTARAFAETYGVTYPSLIDVDEGSVKFAFAQVTAIQATPTTLVLDKQGRVAVRIIGQIESASILSTLVRETLAEEP